VPDRVVGKETSLGRMDPLKSIPAVPEDGAMGARTIVGVLGVSAFLAVAACGSPEERTGFGAATPGGGEGGENGENGGGNNGGEGGNTPAPQPEKPGCAQGAYTEPLPTKTALTGLTFSSAQANSYILGALEKRYPLGKQIVEGGLSSDLAASQGNCIDRFLRDKSSASSVLRQAPTIVHECGHFFDLGEASGTESAYVVRPDLKFTCKAGDTTSRGGKTFARSRIKGDSYYAKRKACGGQAAQGCDFYADIYLDGNPDDTAFQGGDQGYSSVVEEATQYVNSLATALAFQEQYTGSKASERDGILTFLWYIERYLKFAKDKYPAAYKAISEDTCWRQATLSVWDRGWFYLEATKGLSNLGIDDKSLESLVKEPALVAEIDALRKLECK
jgi:hypothetical protein